MKRRIAIIIIIITVLTVTAVAMYYYGNGDNRGLADPTRSVMVNKKTKIPPRPLPDTITTAFYNVENLFDFNLDGSEYDEFKPGWHGWSAEMQKKRLNSAAQVVAAVGADVMGLCEIENKNALRELGSALDNMGMPYPYAAAADAGGGATTTALLSKFPIVEKRDLPVSGSRSILEAAVARGGDTLRFFVNHWPSKRHPESARAAAAQTLRRRLDSLQAGADYVVIGDFNSNYDEYASFRSSGHDDTRGETGINHTMKTVVAGRSPRVSREIRLRPRTAVLRRLPLQPVARRGGELTYELRLQGRQEYHRQYATAGGALRHRRILVLARFFPRLHLGGTADEGRRAVPLANVLQGKGEVPQGRGLLRPSPDNRPLGEI